MIAAVFTHWSWDPSILASLALLAGGYWLYTRGPRAGSAAPSRKRDWCFAAMLLSAFLALESPLDYVADRYLFSAHMVQHLVLMLAVAPLLALAMPPDLVADVKAHTPAWLVTLVTQPVVVFAVFTIDVFAWHAPVLFEATLHSEGVHVLEHLSFLAMAALFWWVALAPDANTRPLPILARMGYVFVGGIPNTILGALLTFAPGVLYPSYQVALEEPGLGRALQIQFGITALGDQELGGLLMWIPGGFVYLLAIIAMFIGWYSRQQSAEAKTVEPFLTHN